MNRYRLLNNIFGWIAFAVAAITYLLTIEPTASFWDCPEFISTAFKYDVGHPPGSPFYMLLGKFFILFTSDLTMVARCINSMTALLSAFTILFLFWTITHLARKVLIKSEEDYTTRNAIAIIGAGMVGALAYTFSDTFWFSAVEGEVYGFSSFFTAIVFWIILKWEDSAERQGSDRWLILMAYMMGLSIGVHILNLLAIPAVVLVFYFKKYTPSVKGVILALLAGFSGLAIVLYGIIPGVIQVACWFELLFVNTMGFQFNTGVYIYLALTVGLIIWAIYESTTGKHYFRMALSYILAITAIGVPFLNNSVLVGVILIAALSALFYIKRKQISARWLHTSLLMFTVLLIGYSSYSIIVIRSSAKPTMDQNSPDNVFSLKSYFNRDQYGDRPLLYGPVYNAPIKLVPDGGYYRPVIKHGEAQYAKKPKTSTSDKDQYVIVGYKDSYDYNDKFKMFFPRVFSGEKPEYAEAYKSWGDIKGTPITYDFGDQEKTDIKPTFGENLKFFFSYQLNFMYWRYFLWNFSGRQNDMQSYGESDRGNWITGITFIDELLLGNQSNMPTELKNNKGRNTYYLLPLLLGLLGVVFMVYGGKKGIQGFWIVAMLFFMTGIAIVIYLNQTPNQPRERDYAYAGSFYAFAIWIGIGVLAIFKFLEKYIPKTVTAIVVSLACLGVPVLMAVQNWDDHDRSGRYTCRDFGQNYLESCKPNAIIFTNGDNDTFPLWYNIEVEGKRTDIRVCNLSYLQTDWYVDQMKREAYKSAPLPISWTESQYLTGTNDVVQVEDVLKKPLDVKTAFDFLLSSDPSTKIEGESFIPTNQLYLPIDAQEVIKNGALPASRAGEILPQLDIPLGRRLTKADLMIIEMLKENRWKRPIYFAITVGEGGFMNLTDHFELTGMAYQVLPIGQKGSGEKVNVDEMYENMMTKFKYGGIDNPKIYLDENILHMCVTLRTMFAKLIDALVQKGDLVRAKKALDYCEKVIPSYTVPYNIYSSVLAESCYKLGDFKKGDKIMETIAKNSIEYLRWYASMDSNYQSTLTSRIHQHLGTLQYVIKTCEDAKQKQISQKYLPLFYEYIQKFNVQ